jgi:hypothetical protein
MDRAMAFQRWMRMLALIILRQSSRLFTQGEHKRACSRDRSLVIRRMLKQHIEKRPVMRAITSYATTDQGPGLYPTNPSAKRWIGQGIEQLELARGG